MANTTRANLLSTGGTEGLTTFEMMDILSKLVLSDFQTSVFLWGPTGIGKSTLVRQLLINLSTPEGKEPSLTATQSGRDAGSGAYKFETYGDYGLIDLRVSLLDPSDIRGLPYPEKNLTIWFPPSELPLVGQEDRFPAKGILLLDELTHAAPAIQSACYSLVLDRKVGPHRIMPGWKIMAASNLATEHAHTFDLPHPLKNRFVHYLLRADLDAYKKWGYATGLDPRIMSFLTWYPTYLHLDGDETQNAFPTPRSWSYVSDMLKAFANGQRMTNVAACIGQGTAVIFNSYLELYDEETKKGFLANLEPTLLGKKKPVTLEGTQAGQAYALSARLAGLVLTDADRWMGPAIAYLLGPTWTNLREISRSTVNDIALINAKAFTKALSADNNALNAEYHTVFRGMAGT